MAKRDIVNVNCEKIIPLIRANEWNNSAFSRKVGKYSSWFGEVLRGNNLPSPEEAAKMCLLLKAEPEEILQGVGATDEETAKLQADIETVRKLVEAKRAKESAPDLKIEGMDDNTAKIVDFIKSASVEELAEVCRYIAYLESKREDKS